MLSQSISGKLSNYKTKSYIRRYFLYFNIRFIKFIIMNIYIDQVLALERENKKLVEIKDFLLPLLMNGQVK